MKIILPNSQLAIHGGEPAIRFPKPHWNWPPKSKSKNNAVLRQMESGILNDSGYPEIVNQLETLFAKFTNRKYALALNSGTSALHASFIAADFGKGTEVLVPSMTFPSTASPLFQTQSTPIFCDVEPETGNICPHDAEDRITKKTKGIVITHLCGHPCKLDELLDLARKHKLFLIEDCSHAHCSTYKGEIIGSHGDMAIFSMDNKKLLATGEGGMLVTNDQTLFDRSLVASDYGPRILNEVKNDEGRRYFETGLGLKHRIHPLSAAIAVDQLPRLSEYTAARLNKLSKISHALENLPGVRPPSTEPDVTRGAFFGYRPFFVSEELNGISIEEFVKCLQAEGMEIRQSSNPPLHLLPLFRDNYEYLENYQLPNAEKFYSTTLSMPTFTFEDDALIEQYILAFEKVCSWYSA